jgi:hypothetical protein
VITKSYILDNLEALDRRYKKTKSSKEALFCSKLALLELCGWIEESMDDMVLRCSIRHLKKPNNRKYCTDEIVKRTYGFDYQKNFRFMLIRLLGLVVVEKLEGQVDPTKYSTMKSTLASLKTLRDGEAHTHLKGMARSLNAPSLTMTQLQPIYEGLMEFDRAIRRKRW